MSDWTDEELASAVRAELRILALQEAGIAYSKAAMRRELRAGPLKARGDWLIEFRMRDISAVLTVGVVPYDLHLIQ